MSFVAGSILGVIGLNDAPAIKAINNVITEAKTMKAKVESAMGDAGGGGAKNFLGGLKSELGKGSALGQFTKLAMGGGAIAGLNLVGRELNTVTGEMVAWRNALADGTMSTGQFTEKLAAAVPVLGQFWEAGRNIRELFTGEEAEIVKAEKAATKHLQTMQKIGKALEGFQKFNVSTGGLIEDIKRADERKMQLMATPEAFRAGLEAQFQFEDTTRNVNSMLRKEGDQVARLAGLLRDLNSRTGGVDKVQDRLNKVNADIAKQKGILDKAGSGSGALEALGIGNTKDMAEAAMKDLEARRKLLENQRDEINSAARALEAEQRAQEKANLAGREAIGIADKLAAAQKAATVNAFGENVEKAARDSVKLPDRTSRLFQLPNPRLQAEEVHGFKTVSNADLPQPFVDLAKAGERQNSLAEAQLAVLTRIAEKIAGGEQKTMDRINLVSMP